MNNEMAGIFWVALTSSVFTLVMWLRAEVQRRRAEKRLWSLLSDPAVGLRSGESAQSTAPSTRRLEQLEMQLEQIVHQVDRLAESQEFLSRVLTDRIDHLPDPRLRTPH